MIVVLIIGAISGGLTCLIVYGRHGVLWMSGGYLIGLILGFAITVVSAIAVESATHQHSNIIGFGPVGALLGPVAAILLVRRKKSRSPMTESKNETAMLAKLLKELQPQERRDSGSSKQFKSSKSPARQ
jgi:hypothetical protein